jgi:hypothetical protein
LKHRIHVAGRALVPQTDKGGRALDRRRRGVRDNQSQPNFEKIIPKKTLGGVENVGLPDAEIDRFGRIGRRIGEMEMHDFVTLRIGIAKGKLRFKDGDVGDFVDFENGAEI